MVNDIKIRKPDDTENLLPDLKSGNEQGILRIYKLYRDEFFQWAISHYQVSEDACADIFQEAVINLFLQARQGKLENLNCTVKTYLFAIGKNLLLKMLAKQKRIHSHAEILLTRQEEDQKQQLLIAEEDPLDERKRLVMQVLENFGEPCKSILRLFYFKALSMTEIARELKYKNENVVKSQKVRCMSELRRLVKEKL